MCGLTIDPLANIILRGRAQKFEKGGGGRNFRHPTEDQKKKIFTSSDIQFTPRYQVKKRSSCPQLIFQPGGGGGLSASLDTPLYCTVWELPVKDCVITCSIATSSGLIEIIKS